MKTVSSELAAVIRPLELKLKLLWIGVFPSFAVYAYLAWQRAKMGGETAIASPQMLPIAVLLGLMVLAQSLVYRWFTLSPRAIAKIVSGNQPVWVKKMLRLDSSKYGAMIKPEVMEQLEGGERNLYAYSSGLFNIVLVQWGMVNTCALFGMMLPPAQYQPLVAIIAGLLSAACMFFHYPGIQSAFAAGLELADFEKGMRRD